VTLEEGVREALAGAAREAVGVDRAWRVIPPENLHVTMKFLGEIPAAKVPALGAAMREAWAGVTPGASLTFGGWALLPGPRDPRVLAVRLSEPAGTLSLLAERLEGLLERLGFPREGRPFLGHVTVARSRARVRGGDLARRLGLDGVADGDADGGASKPLARQALGALALLRSTLGPRGAVYEVVDVVGRDRDKR